MTDRENEHQRRRREHMEKVARVVSPPEPKPAPDPLDGAHLQEELRRHLASDGASPLPPGVSSTRR